MKGKILDKKPYKASNNLVTGPNCAPFRVFEGFSETDLADMLNECHFYAIRLGEERVYELCVEREQARAERNYERQRRKDDEGVWLETRDKNKQLCERVRRLEKYIREISHYAMNFINRIEQMPEFGSQPKYGTGLLGMTWRTSEEALRFIDKKDAAEAQLDEQQ